MTTFGLQVQAIHIKDPLSTNYINTIVRLKVQHLTRHKASSSPVHLIIGPNNQQEIQPWAECQAHAQFISKV